MNINIPQLKEFITNVMILSQNAFLCEGQALTSLL